MEFEKKYILNEYQRQGLIKILMEKRKNLENKMKDKTYGLTYSEEVLLCQLIDLIHIFEC